MVGVNYKLTAHNRSIEYKNKTKLLNNLDTFIFLFNLKKVFDLWQAFSLFLPI